MNVVEISGLRKVYRRRRGGHTLAVDGLDLEVPQGGVFGFLGPNGSGKTTTIRVMLGLVRATQGSCKVLGADSARDLPSVIGRIGSIVETPALFPTMSGRRNLALLARLEGIDRRKVNATLDRVGLGARGDDDVRTYSLGMKQRLGLAAALLKDPEVLVLDEPANGLDPAGIKEIRDVIRTLGNEGRTVFVSSHILTEVRQVCDRVAILSRGRCVAAGPVAEVLSSRHQTGLIVRLADLAAGHAALLDAGMTASIDGEAIRVAVTPAEAAAVTRVLAERGLYLSEIRPDEADLETVFLELTGEEVSA